MNDEKRPRKGRGATFNPHNRYEETRREAEDDGWGNLELPPSPLRTHLTRDSSRSVITYNDSPDIPFDRSINPYRGCEHGCVYCFARPSHAWLGLSPGLDFESRLFYKPDAAQQLRRELGARNYRPAPIALGINTDAYQPTERQLRITRQTLEVLLECRHPLTLVTKSSLIERDLDLLAPLAEQRLVEVAISLTTLNTALARQLEPRAASPQRRLTTIERINAAGIPVSVLVAPVVPVLTDAELESILNAAREAGAREAGYVLLRLPHEVKELFQHWLQTHYPGMAEHVMARVRDSRGGKEYDATFGRRMKGTGLYAELIRKRFGLAYRRLGFAAPPPLELELFRRPTRDDEPQMSLF